MKKIYFLSVLMALAVSARSQADDSVIISADLTQEDGLTFYGRDYGPGDDRVLPLDWLEYQGFRFSFKVYPDDWTDPTGELMMPPRSSVYYLPGGSKAPQWLVYSGNEFTVTSPEGMTIKSLEFSMVADNFKYGEVTVNVGKMECNGGITDVSASDKIPAKPYIWSCDNSEGFSSVTITVGKNQFDGESPQQFSFSSVNVIADANTVSVKTEQADNMVTVFGINGTKLLENAPIEAIDNLEDGIYIVNGRKVIINK